MRKTLSLSLSIVIGSCSLLLPSAYVTAAQIEAVEGKEYRLGKAHGPWMIMVATFSASLKTDSDAEQREQVANADKAAHELVLELRRKGIPAYIFSQSGKLEEIDSFDRYGQPAQRYVAAQRNRISVVAGNYPHVDDKVAQQTLKYLKRLKPKSLENAVFKSTEGQPGPLSRAFLTLNPLLSPEEIAHKVKERDPLLLRLNSGGEYNLSDNPGKYSLVVASFYGKSQTHLMNSSTVTAKFLEFDKKLEEKSSLDQAGVESWALCRAMRAQGIEAYVFHERFRSIVTVGAFETPQDARIAELAKKFAAKYKRNEQTGRNELFSESIQVKDNPRNSKETPLRHWVMDPDPQIVQVPHLR